MKYCTRCGNPLADEAVVCPKCGCATESFNKYAEQNAQKTGSYSVLCIVGFVLAFVCSIAGLICSIIAHKNAIAEGNESSRTLSKAGIIVSAVLFGLEVFAFILIFGIYGCVMCSLCGFAGSGGMY